MQIGDTKNAVFVDWITASQLHPEGGLPIVTGGLFVHYDPSGFARFERNKPASLQGSFETSVRIGCDGGRVFLSGNAGRFSRQDNLYNHGWEGTLKKCQSVLALSRLPAFTSSRVSEQGEKIRGAVVSRLDITCNFATGSEAQARAFIRWLSGRSMKRMKRGFAGDESVWFSNTRSMFKAYIKHIEMIAHGADKNDPLVQWCADQGVVRVEVEVKKRMLSELNMNDIDNITDEKLEELFHKSTEILRAVDRSDEVDILDAVPIKSRVYASAWLAGQDVRNCCSRATLFRHAKVLREYGIDILETRNVETFPTKVRVIDLQPLPVPDWYSLDENTKIELVK
jgi:Phage X family/Phage replication protein CRI